MAETQATQHATETSQDVAEKAPFSFADSLPPSLAEDRYVRYMAERCDEARAERAAAMDELREMRDELRESQTELANTALRGLDQAIVLRDTRAQLAAAQARGWNTDIVWRVCLTVLIVAFLAMVTITTVL